MAEFSNPMIEAVKAIAAEAAGGHRWGTLVTLKFDDRVDGPTLLITIQGRPDHAAYAARLVEGINRAAEEADEAMAGSRAEAAE